MNKKLTLDRAQAAVAEAKSIFSAADAEGRQLTHAEASEARALVNTAERLKNQVLADQHVADQMDRLIGNGPTYVERGDGSGGGMLRGWSGLAKSINIKTGQVRATVSLESLLRSKAISGADDVRGYQPVQGAFIQQDADPRYLYPLFGRAPVGPENLSIEDWRQTSRSASGSVERDPMDTSTKAQLSVGVEHVSEKLRQLAVVLEDVPNAVLNGSQAMNAFFRSELQLQLDQATDEHVLNQIIAANPPGGSVGSTLIEQIRHAVSAMRSTGAAPSVLALSPDDAAALDLTQASGTGDYIFAVRDVGSSSPIWNLRVAESARVTLPLLLDPVRLGVLYSGQVALDIDPFSGFAENISRLRLEGNALLHVRVPSAAYIIEVGS